MGLKEFGLTALSALLRALNGPRRLSDAATLRLLSRLGALLAAIAPGSLFPDWSPPAMGPEVPVALKASDIVADSERSTSHSGAWDVRWGEVQPRELNVLLSAHTPTTSRPTRTSQLFTGGRRAVQWGVFARSV